jgi:hypothetical protein
MCTIVSGQLTGLSTTTAAEFSFLLGLPTLGAATLYEAYKSRAALSTIGFLNVGIGLVVSFVVAWAVVSWFIGFLQRKGLASFGESGVDPRRNRPQESFVGAEGRRRQQGCDPDRDDDAADGAARQRQRQQRQQRDGDPARAQPLLQRRQCDRVGDR